MLLDERVLISEGPITTREGEQQTIVSKARTSVSDLRGKVVWENNDAPLYDVRLLPNGRIQGVKPSPPAGTRSFFVELLANGQVAVAHDLMDMKFRGSIKDPLFPCA